MNDVEDWMARLMTHACCALFALIAGTIPLAAQSVADFYRNKTITVIVITAPGGTYDLYGRLAAQHLPRFLPGEPKGTVQYVPGANGVVGHLRLYNLSPKDGTEFALVSQDIAINQALYPNTAKFDASKLNWIGRLSSYTGVMVIASRTGVKAADDLRRIEVVAGAWGATGQSTVVPTLLNALAGTKFKVVTGYRGAAAVDIALERGEVDALSASWTSLKARKAQWLADKVVMVPFQLSHRRHPDLAHLPQIRELALTPEGRRILEYVESDTGIGFSLAAPPGVPAERIAALRQAYDKMIADPAFLAEAAARKLEIVPGNHQELAGIVSRTLSIPADDIQRLRTLIGAKAP
jgi:tripartite-type tricarboxylate transporter receptor subunit TctC